MCPSHHWNAGLGANLALHKNSDIEYWWEKNITIITVTDEKEGDIEYCRGSKAA